MFVGILVVIVVVVVVVAAVVVGGLDKKSLWVWKKLLANKS